MRTKASNTMKRHPATELAIQKAGGAARVAEKLGITDSAISQWRMVPPLKAKALYELCGRAVSLHELRPDIYPSE